MAQQIAIDINIKGTKDVLDLQKAIWETKKELKAAGEAGQVELGDNLAKELVKLQSQLKQARKEAKLAVDQFTATDQSVGAYERLNAQLKVSRARLKDFEAAGAGSSDEAQKLRSQVEFLDQELKRIDKSVGQTNREVGNYEEALRSALGETNDLVRATAQSQGAFNELQKKLKTLRGAYNDVVVVEGKTSDEAKRLRKELKQVESQIDQVGDEAEQSARRVGTFRQEIQRSGAAGSGFINSFRNFGQIEFFIQGMQEALDVLTEFFQATDASSQLNRKFNESLNDVVGGFVEQKGALEANLVAIENAEAGTLEQKAAIDQLIESQNVELSQEAQLQLALGNTTLAREEATQAIINEIAATETAAQRKEIITELIKVEEVLFQSRKAGNELLITASEEASKNLRQQLENLGGFEDRIKGTLNRINQEGIDFAGTNKEVQKDITETLKEEEEKRTKEADKAAKKRREQAEKERLKFIEGEAKFFASRAQLLLKAEEQLQSATIKAIEDEQEQAIQTEKAAFERRKTQLNAQLTTFNEASKKQAEAIAGVFGEGSQELLDFQAKTGEDRLRLQESINGAIQAEQTSSNAKIAEINKKFADQEIKAQKDKAKKRIDELAKEREQIGQALDLELLRIREKRAQGTIDDVEAVKTQFEARRAAIQGELQKLQDDEAAVLELGIELSEEDIARLELQKQELNTRLAELDNERTAQVKKASEEQLQIQSDQFQKTFEQAANTFLEVANALNSIAEVAQERRLAEIEGEQEQRAANIEMLNEDLQKASGIEKKFLEQRIKEEEQANKQLADQKARVEKEAAIRSKALAITTAVINTALGISQALASLPPPASFVTAAITGALGAVQIATIAAQPLATGGIVGFDGGGKVSQSANIPTQPNGDNVLATLKRGEVVLNAGQQARLGGSKTFAAIGVPGFQTGGLVSPPIGAPNLTESVNLEAQSQMQVQQNSELLAATNNRIDRLQVVYTTTTEESIQEDRNDRKEIEVTANI